MGKRFFNTLVVVSVIGFFCAESGWTAQRLTILHTSEHHGVLLPLEIAGQGSMGGMARRATLVQEIRDHTPHVLLLDSGDILVGTALSSWFRGIPDVKAMSLVGYHAMAVGNHEFDYGLDHMRTLKSLATFPFLCTNLKTRDQSPLPCQPTAIITLNNLSIGLLGIVGTSNFPDTFNRSVVHVLELEDPVMAVSRAAAALETEVDLVVVITHQDTEEDRQLLNRASDVDVMIGGHTEGFDGLITPESSNPVAEQATPSRVFVKTYRQGRTLGRLDLEIDHGKILHARARNIPVLSDLKSDEHVQALVTDYEKQFAEKANEQVGRALIDFSGEPEDVRTQETHLGNLLADLMRKEYDADIALINGGQIRASLPAGPVTLGQVLSVLPFESSIVTITVTGEQLLLALENSVSLFPRHVGRFLQLSGLRVVYDADQPAGRRVTSVHVGEHLLVRDRTYSVVTDAFIADGGDGFTVFQQARSRADHQTPIRDLLLQALARGPLTAVKDRRIRFASSRPSPAP